MFKKLMVATALAASIAALAGTAQASVVTFNASGTGGDGPEGATATITTLTNALTVSLSSLIANPTAAGQEVSDIEITLGSTPSSVSLTGSSGTLIDIAPGGAVTYPGGSITHWGTALSGSTITLATAGTGSVGGKPIDLIIGSSSGPYTNANPSITGRNPQIAGTATFDLAALGVTSSTAVTGAVFSFGTGPDNYLPGVPGVPTVPSVPVPEPSTLAVLGTGIIALGLMRRKRT